MEHKLYALERLVEELPESNVQIQTYESGVKPRYLSDGVRLCFTLPDGRIEVQIGKRRGTDTLQLSSPDGRLLIYPEISNEIGVKVGRL
jgi:hypothetical protein